MTGLTDKDLTAALHDLHGRRLLAPSTGHQVALRHPLLAEAIRRHAAAHEPETQYSAVAGALARSPDPEPAEVAAHWRAAGDAEQE